MPKDEPASLSIVESEVVFAGKIWNVVRERFEFNNDQLVREFVAHTGAVAVVALNEANEVLLIRQYRHPVRSYLWELPAGLLDIANEPNLEAAKRELLEETGFTAGSWSELIAFHTTPGGNDETIWIYLAQNLTFKGHELELQGEEKEIEVRWVELQQALESVLESEMKSPTAAVGIMALALKQQRENS
jgi:8-oxo-dGTP pyrophosphatase MutT (NUDIX family)